MRWSYRLRWKPTGVRISHHHHAFSTVKSATPQIFSLFRLKLPFIEAFTDSLPSYFLIHNPFSLFKYIISGRFKLNTAIAEPVFFREKKRGKMANEDLERGGGMKNRGNNGHPPGYYSSTYYAEASETHWTSWLIPMFVVANVAVFVVVMYVNDCPKKNTGIEGACVAKFLRRLSFQPLRENPLFGPSSSTWVFCNTHFLICFCFGLVHWFGVLWMGFEIYGFR